MAEKRRIYTSFHDIPPREYMYFPKGTVEVGKPGRFSRLEIQHLLISILVLTVVFTLLITRNNLINGLANGFNLEILPYGFGVAFLSVLTAFFFHEISHKFMAQKLKLWAEYRMFPQGLGIALLLGILAPFVFAAPGAVMFMGGSRYHETGKIAVVGPLANLIVALITFPLFMMFFETTIGQIFGIICLINALMATFNLLPFGPLDVTKIIRWNATVWIILLIVAITQVVIIYQRNPLGL